MNYEITNMSGFKPMPNRYRGLTYAILLFVVLATANARTISCTTQSKQAELSVDDRDEMQAKSVATIVLKLFHNNELSKLYRERVSDLQKETGLTTEAKAIEAYTPMVLAIPGEPMERRLLNIRRIDLLPIFFRDHKADYCILVYLSKYASGDWHEEIYLVKEHGEWKVAALLIKMAF